MDKIAEKFFDAGEINHLKRDFKRRFSKASFKNRSVFWKWQYYSSKPQYKTLLMYRLHNVFKPRILKNFFGFFYRISSLKSGLEISTPVLGGGMVVPHWGRIILNAQSIGNDLYVFHNVTVGNDYGTGRPLIGSNVFIGTNTVILGNISVGDNVLIGACSFVRENVPSNTLIAGNPARVIKEIEDCYIQDMLGYEV
jgi:serine acetyltransferase